MILPKAQDIIDVKLENTVPNQISIYFVKYKLNSSLHNNLREIKHLLEVRIYQLPIKSLKRQELTQQQNEENTIFSSKRIFVEHLIRLVKIFRIAEQRFRLRFNHYNQVIGVVCGLVRLRIEALIL